DDVEAATARVEDGVLDAVVGGEPSDVQAVDAAVAQQLCQLGVLERRIALTPPVPTLVDQDVQLVAVEACVQLRARRSLHAMNRPGILEGRVVRGVPVARRQNEADTIQKAVERL